MDSGNQSLFISPVSVREALNNLIRVAPQQSPNALHYLLLVDLYLTTNQHISPPSQRRYFALNDILTSLITEHYAHQRNVLDLPAANTMATLQETLKVIESEGQRASVELLCWSWLYHHYVHVDLSISYKQFCVVAHIDERTLRRYQQHGIHRLTERIAEREGQARKEQRKRWLYSHLPGYALTPLIGRDDQIHDAAELLRTAKPAHLQITGSAGIGKSTFVGTVVKDQIDSGLVDRVIWVAHPHSVEFVRQHLIEELLPERSNLSLREYGLLQRTTVVLDDIEIFLQTGDPLDELLDELNSFCVLMTSRTYDSHLGCAHMVLKELLKDDLFALLDRLATSESQLSHEELFTSIWGSVGGNPMAAILMFRHWPFYRIQTLNLDDLFAHAYTGMGTDLRRSWLLFALLPPVLILPERVITIWPGRVDETKLAYLITHHLLDVMESETPIKCVLMSAGRRFIENRYRSDYEIQKLVDELITDLFQATGYPDSVFDIIEHILLCNWLQLEDQLREQWLTVCWNEGLQRGHYAQWRGLLEPYSKSRIIVYLGLQIGYGICLRRLSQGEKAQAVFERVIESSGQSGLFLEQATAALECAILLRRQGKYKNALELLSHVGRLLSHQPDAKLLYRLRLEQAQIALDANDPEGVENILSQLPETPETFMLWCETHFLKRNYDYLYALLKRDSLIEDSPSYLARIHALLGQSYEQQNDLHNAYEHFCLALTLLERQEDLFALSRIQSNLAAVMIQKGAYHDTRVLLEQAERVQEQLHDQVGLTATRHNIRLLIRKVVR